MRRYPKYNATIVAPHSFSKSANAMKNCGYEPTQSSRSIVENTLQVQTKATGTIVRKIKDTLGNKTRRHYRLLLAALEDFLQLTAKSSFR
jgi:DNA-binding LacI/PurR family transcriptional regulator